MHDNIISCHASPVDDLKRTSRDQVNDWKLLFLCMLVSSFRAMRPNTCMPT